MKALADHTVYLRAFNSLSFFPGALEIAMFISELHLGTENKTISFNFCS